MSTKLAIEVLRAARELITPEGRWSKGSYAWDAAGRCVPPKHSSACSWCAIGALRRIVDPAAVPDTYGAVLEAIYEEIEDHCSITEFNDDQATTQPQVLALFDRAAARLEARL